MPQENSAMDSSMEPGRDAFLPAFSVMVTGHRGPRLRRLDPDGPAPALRDTLQQVLTALRIGAGRAFDAGDAIYGRADPIYRLFTGVATGADELAAQVADAAGFRLNVIAPGRAADSGYTEPEPRRAIALGMRPTSENQRKLRQSDYSLRDDLTLCFADVLVAIWDGREPFPMRSGTSLAVKTALLRRTPVIWLQPHADGQPPEVRVTDPQRLTDTALTEIDVLGATPDLIARLFVTLEPDSAAFERLLDTWLLNLLAPFATTLEADNAERRLRERIARQHSLLGFVQAWGRYLLRRPGGRRAARPLSLLAWLQGTLLWLRVMLNPPQPSPELQVLEYLTLSVPAPRWQDRLVSRLHYGLAGLVKTTPAEAWQRFLRGSELARLDARPGPESPIREQFLPAYFAFGEAQARRCAQRYRDDTWLIFYAAAMAVFCAVAGALYLWPASVAGWGLTWVLLEFLLLRLIVGKVLQSRFRGWHRRWMGYRYMTEQLRVLRLGFPLLILPDSMRQTLWEPGPSAEQPMRLLHPESWVLQRILVAEGLPRSAARKPWFRITHHNEAILQVSRHALAENERYFYWVHHTLHQDHHRLHRFSLALFALTFAAVLSHFVFTLPGVLFFTAFFPAWGAAIHGILSQNEVVRVSAMAQQTLHRLRTLDTALSVHKTVTDSGIRISNDAEAWARTQELRGLVSAVADTLETENRQWVTLLQHNEPDLPG
ncbi:hypothetical protein E4656_00365 [Natronospirillum operosum]|uniref:Uncharacterized protein n=1 Tax=Natronospirillum operosum TaxID=2759953 RepID=A0A4Z0WD13_9GAMM|nr:hypothetical protein [Natronospirillum operosum]TGG94920.1 hypothetical protein E4656_00365 [Natronospirillum operosum]